ncbi:serine--tRNA ligase [Candidatus Woesearchaeota archaeon]|nr:serine--tRNA ligase [Candidatus Woesearchaeota archaeon]
MLDIKLIREHPEIVRKDLVKRDMTSKLSWIDDILQLDGQWRDCLQELEKLRHRRNKVTEEINLLKKQGKDISPKIAEVKQIPKDIETQEAKTAKLKEKLDYYLMSLPNILHASVPDGKSEADNQAVAYVGTKPSFSFPLKSHVDLLEELGLVDLERAAKIAGARFYFLKDTLALLDLALQRFAIDALRKKGYMLIQPPYLMRRKPYTGVTDLTFFEDELYKIENDDLYLIATSEHPLTAQYLDEVIDEKDLPVKLVGISPCFRKEAGSHGKDTKGIFRVHQFHKVEQIIICKPEDSWKFHEELLNNALALVNDLGFHARIMNMCAADIGTVAAKKYDIECWMPAQNTYREIISCSNCTDYQARRLNIRWTDGKNREYVHTLNSTALATSRVIVAILENYQQQNGNILLPPVLHPLMDGMSSITKALSTNAVPEVRP